jgi:hypothetical protein
MFSHGWRRRGSWRVLLGRCLPAGCMRAKRPVASFASLLGAGALMLQRWLCGCRPGPGQAREGAGSQVSEQGREFQFQGKLQHKPSRALSAIGRRETSMNFTPRPRTAPSRRHPPSLPIRQTQHHCNATNPHVFCRRSPPALPLRWPPLPGQEHLGCRELTGNWFSPRGAAGTQRDQSLLPGTETIGGPAPSSPNDRATPNERPNELRPPK